MKWLTKIIKSASLWAIMGVALRVGSGIITLPLALRVLSPSELGLYYTFLSLTGLVMLLDFGFSQTIGRNAAFAMGGAKEFQAVGIPESTGKEEPNWVLLAELFSAVKIWYHGAGSLLAVLMLVPGSMYLDPLIHEAGLSDQYLWCWWFFAAVTVFSFVSTYWPGLLLGIGSVKSAARIGMISQVFGLVILLVGLLSGAGLWSYGLSSLASTAISIFSTRKAFSRDAKLALEVRVNRGNRNRVLLRLWPMAWRQGVVMLGAFLIQRGNTLICSAKLGLEETASYGFTSNLLNLVFQMAIIPLSLAWPLIGRLRVNHDFGRIRQIFFLRLYGGLGVAVIALICIALWGNLALKILGAQTSLLSTPLLAIFGIMIWLETHHSQYASLVLSENKNPFVWAATLSGVAIFFLSWWAAGTWGLLGMILAQGAVQLACNNWWPVIRALRGLRGVNSHKAINVN